MKNSIVPIERIENMIYLIRSQKVMLDRDLAKKHLGGFLPYVFTGREKCLTKIFGVK